MDIYWAKCCDIKGIKKYNQIQSDCSKFMVTDYCNLIKYSLSKMDPTCNLEVKANNNKISSNFLKNPCK